MANRSSRSLVHASLVVLFATACTSSSEDTAPTSPSSSTSPGTAPPASTDTPAAVQAAATPLLQDLSVSTGDLIPAFDPKVLDYTVSSLNALRPVVVTAAGDVSTSITVAGNPASAGVGVPITLKPRQDIMVTASIGEQSRTYTIHYLPDDFPAYQITTSSQAGTETLMLTPGWIWLSMIDRSGNPLYYRKIGKGITADFKQHVLADGTIRYSYANDVAPGRVYLMDQDFKDIGSLELLKNRDHDVLAADVHDFVILGEEHYLIMSYAPKTVDLSGLKDSWSNAAPVTAAVIQEIDHGAVTFEWDSSDHPSLYSDSVDGNAFTAASTSDYVHMNSMQVDPSDGNLIISLRHTNSILKLDRHTGNTIWTLGGRSDDFGLTADQRFSHQHHARKLDDGTLLVFDNGNNAHATRVISMSLDEANKHVSSFSTVYTRPAEQPDTTYMGSAFRMSPSRYVIGWGGRADTTSTWPAVTEIVDGAPVWSLTFTTSTVFSYRATPLAN